MKHTLKITAIAFTLGLAGFSFAPAASAMGDTAIAKAAENQAQSQTLTFAIDKMTCAMCPITVRKAMEKVEGVGEAKVDFDAKTATVTFDPAKTTPEMIAAASTNAGYPAQVVKAAAQ